MTERLSFKKPLVYSLCSFQDSNKEKCWTFCPTFPRFYKKEKKQKMVEVGPRREREIGWENGEGEREGETYLTIPSWGRTVGKALRTE